MKTQLEIMMKWEVIQEAVHNLRMKPELTDFERLYIIQMESNMNELKWVLGMEDPTEEQIKDSEYDRDQEMRSDMQEEEVDDEQENTGDTLSI